ncbi:MAG: RNA 2',3'-cyclic phosphodiesterase [Candidatus Hermodarchaeota archaeon]
MIRSFIAIELEEKDTIEKITLFSQRLKQNQSKLKIVEPENLHMTLKFLGNIPEPLAPQIYIILQEEINKKLFQSKIFKYHLKGVGQFNKFSVIWVKLLGDIQFLQKIKDTTENFLFEKLKIERDNRPIFKPHLTIGRLQKNRINYKTFDIFKKLINENKDLEFGAFNINRVKLKKSQLTSQGPLYSDLVY